jgi:hypothetical protein
MNLIEELAKQEMIKNHYIEHWTAGEKTGYWDGIADKELFRSKVKDFIPIFAEWIKGVEKISLYEPFSTGEDEGYRVARTCWNSGFDKAIETILSELEKMK